VLHASANPSRCFRRNGSSPEVASVAAVYDRRISYMTERLHRLETTFQRYPIYFVTACTHDRRHLLADIAIQTRLLEFGKEGEMRGDWLGAYALMPDHLHLFVAIDDSRANLSTWIKSLKNSLSKSLRESGVPGPHWQKGFFDHLLRSDESYSEKWEYVRQNPVRAGLIGNADDWKFLGTVFRLEFHNASVR